MLMMFYNLGDEFYKLLYIIGGVMKYYVFMFWLLFIFLFYVLVSLGYCFGL